MTNSLHSFSNRKHGWRVKLLIEEGTNNIIQNKVMIINGYGAEYLIEAGTDNPDRMLHSLEDQVAKRIIELEEKDMIFMTRESIIFAAFARVIRSQSQCFVNLLTKERKHDLQMFNNHVEKMVRSLEINYEKLLGKEQANLFLDDHEDIVFDVFSQFKTAIDTERLEEFVNYVKDFDKAPAEGKEIKMSTVK